MARKIEEIYTEATEVYKANLAAVGIIVTPESWSVTNIQRLMLYTCAYMVWVVESLLDVHLVHVSEELAALKPSSIRWYVQKCLEFQYGFALIPETDQFDNTGSTEQQILESKVIKYATVEKLADSFGRIILRIKIAGASSGAPIKLSPGVVGALEYYFKEDQVAPAGDRLIVESGDPDSIKMKWLIKYDPLQINAQGQRIDGSELTPVKDAIEGFLLNVYKFGGYYVPTFHIDYVQQVQGVFEPRILECSAKYGLMPYVSVTDRYKPDAGYLKFYNATDLEIIYQPINL
jgi:hypothetical protein